ncbi:MAG: cell division protein FtsA [Chitinophagaceae bacterium]|nr:cell division protein FtsA [Chitinophagaceae bacterium]
MQHQQVINDTVTKEFKNNNPVIVGLDIGTTKIAAIAGRKDQYGKLEILGFGKADSSGVNHGMVLNIEECIRSIHIALENCLASNPNLTIKEVYVGIAGQHIKSLQTRGDRVLANIEEEIRKEDIDSLLKDQYKTFIPTGDQIIDIIPQDFTVDAFGGYTLQQVVGMTGIKIGANFHIVTGDKTAIRNIHRCVTRSGLSTKDLVLQPLASAAAVMCPEDLESGVAIVDIGGGTTDLAVFHDGMLKHTAVIPIAGVNITNDIRQGLGVLRTQAEQMKVQFGMALAEEAKANAFITIPGLKGQAPKEISAKNLAHIIQSRMDEILEYVMYHLKQLNLVDKLHGGIILTGGGSQLKHLIQLTEFRTGLPARIGLPNEHLASGYAKDLMMPMYSTCIGLILRGYDDFENNRMRFISNNTEEVVLNSDQVEGKFVEMARTFELTPEQLLKQEFGESFQMTPTPQQITPQQETSHETNQQTVLSVTGDSHQSDLFENYTHPQDEVNEPHEVKESKTVNRKLLIKNVFGTVKNTVLYWFENVDDERLDQ